MGRYVKINGVLVPIAGIGGQDTNYKGETMSDWEALTQEEKDQYDTVDLTGDYYDVLDELDAMADQIVAVNEELSDVNNILGAKNLLPNNATSQTLNGVTFTVNADKSITVSGTATADTWYDINSYVPISWGNNEYVINGRGTLSSDVYYFIALYDASQTYLRQYNVVDEKDVIIAQANDAKSIRTIIRVLSGKTVSGTCYPMLRPASIADDTYVPYTMTNKELTTQLSGAILQKVVSYTYTLTDHINYGNFTVPTVNGYSFMGVIGIKSNHYIECMVNAWPETRTTITYGIRDISNYITSLTVSYYLLYVRNNLAKY